MAFVLVELAKSSPLRLQSVSTEAGRAGREPSSPSASIAFLISGLLCEIRLSIPTMSPGESAGTGHPKHILSPIRPRADPIPWHTWVSQLKKANGLAARAYGAAITSFPGVASADGGFPR